MNTKYRYKPSEIDAIQFHCTPEGIAAIAVFGGIDFTGINNQRVNGTPAAAYVNGLVIPEGSWLLRNATGMYKVLKDNVFTAVCEPAIPAPAVVEAIGAVEAAPVVEDGALVTREFALSHGLVRYFTGEACRNGHVAERYTRGQCCVTCIQDSTTKSRKRAKVAEKRNATRARKACTGPFAPLAASISY